MTGATETPSLLVPARTRLIHIGPPKTGTTSVQSAFHAGREALLAQGVHYAGPTHQPSSAVRAIIGKPNPMTGKPPSMWLWRSLVLEIKRASGSRVVVSSEFLADARPDIIRRIVADLDPTRIHVVVTLRPLARLLASQWQQYVQSGLRVPFDDWLRVVFGDAPESLTPGFWLRHRHDRLIQRWAEVVGPERVTAIVLDEGDHDMVLRTFERLVGLRDGTLVAEANLANRSMTLPEVELVRAFNVLAKAEGVGRSLRTRVMTYGATAYIGDRTPGPDEPRVTTPAWALERAGTVARDIVDGIAASGVQVVGDLDSLAQIPSVTDIDTEPQPVIVPPDLAAAAAMGVLIATGLTRGRGDDPAAANGDGLEADPVPVPRRTAEPFDLFRVPTEQLADVLIRRVLRDGRSRISGLRRRIG